MSTPGKNLKSPLDQAKEAIISGNIKKLTSLLNKKHKVIEEYTSWEIPEGNWGYDTGIPDDIPVIRKREVTKPVINLNKNSETLYLLAAQFGRIDVMHLLTDQYGKAIDIHQKTLQSYCNNYSHNNITLKDRINLDTPHVVDNFNQDNDVASQLMFKNAYETALNEEDYEFAASIYEHAYKYMSPNHRNQLHTELNSISVNFVFDNIHRSYGTGKKIIATLRNKIDAIIKQGEKDISHLSNIDTGTIETNKISSVVLQRTINACKEALDKLPDKKNTKREREELKKLITIFEPIAVLSTKLNQVDEIEEKAKEKLQKIQNEILNSKWNTGIFGGVTIVDSKNNSQVVPTGVSKIINEIEKARTGTISYETALNNVKDITSQSAKKDSHGFFNKRHDYTQTFYDKYDKALNDAKSDDSDEDQLTL